MNNTPSTTFTVRVDTDTKQRLESLATNTGRSRSFLAAEAIHEYLNVNEWQVAGIKDAIDEVDLEGTIPHAAAEAWLAASENDADLPIPEPTKRHAR
jgi:RHH-type transcriptional regulator, rel operon repressor / antitoxin RelB